MKVHFIGVKKFNFSEKLFEDFIDLLQSQLPLKKNIRIVLTNTREGSMTTGVRKSKEIRILANKRLLADILRTLAHEWVHEFQHQKLGFSDKTVYPDIGGPVENMASVLASIYLKKFQKQYPLYKKELFGEN